MTMILYNMLIHKDFYVIQRIPQPTNTHDASDIGETL